VPSVKITYAKLGNREEYAQKIYGKGFDPANTSWDLFPAGTRNGWPLHKIYEMLHERLDLRVMEVHRSDMLELVRQYGLVFNSAPAALFAERDDTPVEVLTERVWIKTEPVDAPLGHPGIIVYEASPAMAHYRYSFLEGRDSWEFPEAHGDPGGGVLVSKPLSISHPPMSKGIVPIGRYGQWKKGVLVDSVFGEVSRVLQQYFYL